MHVLMNAINAWMVGWVGGWMDGWMDIDGRKMSEAR